MFFPTNGCWEENHIPFPLCLCLEMNVLLSFQQINPWMSLGFVSNSSKKANFQKCLLK